MTIESFIREAAQRFFKDVDGHNRKTLRELVAFRLGVSPARCFSHPEMEIPADIETILWRDVDSIVSGVPLGYLFGSVQFLDEEFLVDSRALCPRVETEELCDRVIKRLIGGVEPKCILDMGCGSGVLGLRLAMEFPDSQAVLCDRTGCFGLGA